ncbi:MAG: aspartyl protease family protein [Kofleriaceae bacterium]
MFENECLPSPARARLGRRALPLLVALGACSGAPPVSHPPGAGVTEPTGEASELARVLARSREASGGPRWEQVAFLEQRGELSIGGLRGELTSLEDLRDGRSRSSYALGPITGGEGFDGEHAWRLDPGGELVLVDSAEALARSKTAAWLTRHGYHRADAAAYTWLGVRELDGQRHAVIEATPPGGSPLQLWFSEASGLLTRTIYQEGLDTVTTTFDDYRPTEAGVLIPMRITTDTGDPRNLSTIVLSAAVTMATAPPEALARPSPTSEAYSFTGGAREVELPFELINNHIYIQAKVNGQPVRLLVDTGGVNLLTAAAIQRLGLSSEGAMAGRGAGGEQVDVGFAKASSLELGALVARDPTFYIFDFGRLIDVEDVAFDGLIGHEFFHRFIVHLDYAAGRLRLTDPAAAPPPPATAIAVPFVLNERIPLIEAEIDGVPARVTIDTGSRASLTASSPFVAKHGLIARYQPRFETITGWGVGGPVRSSPARVAELKLGGAAVRGVLVDLFTGTKGAFADPRADANLGGGVLRRFAVTFDYGKRVMYLEPNARLTETDRYDRSGLFLVRRGAPLEVAAVTAGSGAERAGVQVGDLVHTIDGIEVSKRPLAAWRKRLREGAPGSKVPLTLERGGKRLKVSVTLSELVP